MFAVAFGVPFGLVAAAVWWLGFTALFHTFWALVDGVRWLCRAVAGLPSWLSLLVKHVRSVTR